MKKFQRIGALILALIMCLSLGLVTSAAPTTEIVLVKHGSNSVLVLPSTVNTATDAWNASDLTYSVTHDTLFAAALGGKAYEMVSGSESLDPVDYFTYAYSFKYKVVDATTDSGFEEDEAEAVVEYTHELVFDARAKLNLHKLGIAAGWELFDYDALKKVSEGTDPEAAAIAKEILDDAAANSPSITSSDKTGTLGSAYAYKLKDNGTYEFKALNTDVAQPLDNVKFTATLIKLKEAGKTVSFPAPIENNMVNGVALSTLIEETSVVYTSLTVGGVTTFWTNNSVDTYTLPAGYYLIKEDLTNNPGLATRSVPFIVSLPLATGSDPLAPVWDYDVDVYPKNVTSPGPEVDKKVDVGGVDAEKPYEINWSVRADVPADINSPVNYTPGWPKVEAGKNVWPTAAQLADSTLAKATLNDGDFYVFDHLTVTGATIESNTLGTPRVLLILSDGNNNGETVATSTIASGTDYVAEIDANKDLHFILTAAGKSALETARNSNMGSKYKVDSDGNFTLDSTGTYTVVNVQIEIPYTTKVKALTADTATFTNKVDLHYENGSSVYFNATKETPTTRKRISVYKYEKSTSGDLTKVPLAGAEFEIYSYAADGTTKQYVKDPNNASNNWKLESNSSGFLEFYGLDTGKEYFLDEVKAPTGYVLLTDDVSVDSAVYSANVYNAKTFILPITGGSGTILFTIGGILLIGLAVVFLVVSRKKKATNA